jgi:hypothetical protein
VPGGLRVLSAGVPAGAAGVAGAATGAAGGVALPAFGDAPLTESTAVGPARTRRGTSA